MRKTASLLLLLLSLLLTPGTGVSAPSQQGPRNIGKAVRGQRNPQRNPNRIPRNRLAPIQDVVEGFYVSRFQRELELDDNQFAKVLPALRESLQKRTELGRQRTRALIAMRQALRNGASDEEILERIREVDAADAELRAVQERLLREVDPVLTPSQRARLRIVQPNLEQRIRNLIERSRNPNAQRRRPPPQGRPTFSTRNCPAFFDFSAHRKPGDRARPLSPSHWLSLGLMRIANAATVWALRSSVAST